MKKLSRSQSKKKKKEEKIDFKHPRESTQMLMPIKDIYKGIIITKDERYVKILEVLPVPFSMMTNKEKGIIITNFAKVLNLAPDNLQLTEITLPADLTPQLNYLHKAQINEESPECKALQEQYKEKLLESQRTTVSRRFFISFYYEKVIPVFQQPNLAEIAYDMNSMAETIKDGLEACGNKVLHMDEKSMENINFYTAEILYTILNRGTNRPNFDTFFTERVSDYYEHYGNRNFYIPPTDFISPDTLSFHDKKYVVVNNNLYQTYYYIPSAHYPDYVTASWLTPFINSIQGIDVNIYTRRVHKEKVINSLRRNMVYSTVDMNTADNASQTMDVSSATYQAASYLKDGLVAGDNFYYLSVLFTISGESPEIVDKKAELLEKIAERMEIKVFNCLFDQQRAFFSALPLCNLDNSIAELTQRNCLSEGAASAYPFVSFEINDPEGILFGTNTYNNSMTIVDIFDRKKFVNPNMFFSGQSGSGKTYSLCLMALRMRELGKSVIIIAPEKQHEFRRPCLAIGGEFIEIAAGSKSRINIMEILRPDPEAKSEMASIDGAYDDISLLADKTSSLKTFFNFYIKDMNIQEAQLLDQAIINTYAKFGITMDNESLYDPEDKTHTRFRKMPIISDLEETLNEMVVEKPALRRIVDIIPYFTKGSGSSFNGQTNVDLSNPFTVIGLEKMKDDNLKLGMYMAMEYSWGKIREDRTAHSLLIMDEWWKLASNREAAQYSMNIARTIRAYGSAMLIATQDLEDIMQYENGIYGKAVLQNCYTKILLGNNEDGTQREQALLNLTDEECMKIQRYKNGKCLALIGNLKLEMQFESSALENELISTDSDTLRKVAKKRQQDAEQKEKEEKKFSVFNDEVVQIMSEEQYFKENKKGGKSS